MGKIYSLKEIKHESEAIFKNSPYIQEAYLFGSYARGEADEESDLDYYVILNREYDLNSMKQILRINGELGFAFDKDIDLLVPEDIKDKKSFMENIEKDKVLIYERDQ